MIDGKLVIVNQLMNLRGGVPYRYMMEHLFPEVRQSAVITITYKKLDPIEVKPIEFQVASSKPPKPKLLAFQSPNPQFTIDNLQL